MKKSAKLTILAAVAGASGLMLSTAPVASASVFSSANPYGTGPVDTIYSDSFAAPGTNVNSATTDPNAIVGNPVAGGDGGSGGTPAATYLSTPIVTGITGTPDADWDYSGSTSATITSPAANVVAGEDTKTITNLTLPLVPVVGDAYDLELTMVAAPGTGAHGLEMAFLFNGGNAHNTTAQAISNNDPIGLILDRDATSSTTTSNYFEVFENTGTGSDNSFAPSASALTGGTPGTKVTVDEIFTPTGATTGTESVYLNGVLATGSPFNLTGLTGGISDIQFGDNRDALGTFTNFSLTAEAVPEPASAALLLLGGGLAMGRRRRSTMV
jgi:PEP-CTERM motif